MVKETEYYDLLGVAPDAADNDIRRQYKKLALKYHPDKNQGDPQAAEMFKKVAEAYEVLSDEGKRKLYDQYGKKGLEEGGGGGGFHDASDIFSAFFGGGRRERGEPKPKDIVHELPISLEDFYCGKSKKIAATRDRLCTVCSGSGCKANASEQSCDDCGGRGAKIMRHQIAPGMMQQVQVVCPSCRGRRTKVRPEDLCSGCNGEKVVKERKVLEVHIEKGMKKGDHIRFQGEGDQVPGVKLSGDVLILLTQKPHEVFKRIGNHLIMEHTITLQEALCGFELPLEHLDKRLLLIKVPAGQVIDPAFAWIVHREGMPQAGTGGGEKGNLVITFKVTFPEKPLPPQKSALVAEALEAEPVAEPPKDGVEKKLSTYTPRPKRDPRQQQRGGGPQVVFQQGGGGGGANCQQQ